MNHEPPNPFNATPDRDDAVTRRLARLGTRPVDTRRLEQRLRAALDGAALEPAPAPAGSGEPAQAEPAPAPDRRVPPWTRALLGLAATVALAAGLVFAIPAYTPTASATPIRLVELHRKAEAGYVALPTAASMHAVNQTLREQRVGRRLLPAMLQDVMVQSCCLADVRGDLVGLAVLDSGPTGSTPLSLVITRAAGFAHPMGVRVEVGDQTFFGHELDGVPMMMANRGDRWLCVMGDRSYEELARVAAAAEF